MFIPCPHRLPPAFMRLLAAALLFAAATAWAADDKKAVRAQMARIQQMQAAQQALEAEKSQVLVEKLELEGKLKAASAHLEKAKAGGRQVGALKRELEGARAENTALLDKISTTQAEHEKTLTNLQAQLKAAQEQASQLQRQLASTQDTLKVRGQALATCETQNQGLYKLNTSLLAQYEKRSCGQDWLKGGLFTQLGRVQTENDSETIKDKLEDLRVKPAATP